MDGMIALQLYFAMQEDLLAEKLAWKVGEEKLSELFPNYKDGFPAVFASSILIGQQSSHSEDGIARLLTWLDPYMGTSQSNNWIVDTKPKVSLAAMLINAPPWSYNSIFFMKRIVQTQEVETVGSMV